MVGRYDFNECYDDIVREVEYYGRDPYEMLGRYLVRDQVDHFKNFSRVDALKRHIKNRWVD